MKKQTNHSCQQDVKKVASDTNNLGDFSSNLGAKPADTHNQANQAEREFNLSEKIFEAREVEDDDYFLSVLLKSDVKEFIRKLKNGFENNFILGSYFEAIIKPTIDSLAGDKLK